MLKEETILRVATTDGKRVEAKSYTVDDFAPFEEGVATYVRRRGADEAQREFNAVMDGWENKPVKGMIADFIERKIPVGYESCYGRILKTASVKLWRSVFGKVLNDVRER